jgi:hypothetical protein
MMPTRLPPFHGLIAGGCPSFEFCDDGLRDAFVDGGDFHGRLHVNERVSDFLLLTIDAQKRASNGEEEMSQ